MANQGDDKTVVEPLDEHGGFSMDFSIHFTENVPDLVDEMMRLSAFGYFKEARELSDSVLAQHTSIFAIAAERMRLRHDQGDFDGLLHFVDSVNRTGWNQRQTAIVDLFRSIASKELGLLDIHTESDQEPPESTKFKMPDIPIPSLFATRENNDVIEEAILRDILRLRLWRLSVTAGCTTLPLLPLTTLQHRDLSLSVVALISQNNYWAANIVLEACCYPIGIPGVFPRKQNNGWPNSEVLNLFHALEKIENTTLQGKLAYITLSQTMCETLASLRYFSTNKDAPYTGVTGRIRRSLRRQANLLECGTINQYGPRCYLRYTLMTLREKATDSIKTGGLPLQKWDISVLKSVLQDAKVHHDKLLVQQIVSNHGEEPETSTYRLHEYSNVSEEMSAPNVTLQLIQVSPDIRRMCNTILEPETQVNVHKESSAMMAGSPNRTAQAPADKPGLRPNIKVTKVSGVPDNPYFLLERDVPL